MDPWLPQRRQRLVAGQRQPQGVGPAACAVLLVQGCPEGRTHGAALQFAADARTVTQLDGADETLLLAVVEQRRRLLGRVAGTVAQVVGHRWRVDDLAGVEQVVGIERLLDAAERLVDRFAEHLAVPLAAGQAVAVLAAQGAAEFEDQVGDIFGDPPHAGHVVAALEVQYRADVQAAHTGVAVEGAAGAVARQHLLEAGHEVGQVFGRDGGIFDKRHRLAVAGQAEQQRHRSAAHAPQRVAQGRVEGRHQRGDALHAVQPPPQFLNAIGDLGRLFAAEFDHEQCRRPALHRGHGVPQRQVVTGQVNQHLAETPGTPPARPSPRPAKRSAAPTGRARAVAAPDQLLPR